MLENKRAETDVSLLRHLLGVKMYENLNENAKCCGLNAVVAIMGIQFLNVFDAVYEELAGSHSYS